MDYPYNWIPDWITAIEVDIDHYYGINLRGVRDIYKISNDLAWSLPEYFVDIIFLRAAKRLKFYEISDHLTIDLDCVKNVYFEFIEKILDAVLEFGNPFINDAYQYHRLEYYERYDTLDTIWKYGFDTHKNNEFFIKELDCSFSRIDIHSRQDLKLILTPKPISVYLLERDDKKAIEMLIDKNKKQFQYLWKQAQNIDARLKILESIAVD